MIANPFPNYLMLLKIDRKHNNPNQRSQLIGRSAPKRCFETFAEENMKKITLILNWLLISGVVFLGTLSVIFPKDRNTEEPIRIIGGADGPTAIFVGETPVYLELLPYIILVTVLLMNIFVIRRQKINANQSSEPT